MNDETDNISTEYVNMEGVQNEYEGSGDQPTELMSNPFMELPPNRQGNDRKKTQRQPLFNKLYFSVLLVSIL